MIFNDNQIKRILGNFGFAFFSSLSALSIAGLDGESGLKAALIAGFIQGGLAAFQEIKRECEPKQPATTGAKSGKATSKKGGSFLMGCNAGQLTLL